MSRIQVRGRNTDRKVRNTDPKGRDTDPKGRNTDPKDLVPDDRTQDKSAGQTIRKTPNTQGYYYNG